MLFFIEWIIWIWKTYHFKQTKHIIQTSLFGVPAADDGLNPVVRIVINNIVSKRFGLTKAEVSGLTIEEKARLIKSTFSEAEIKRLLEEEVNRFFAPFKSLLHLFFPALAECEKKVGNIDDTVEFYFNLIFFSVGGSYFPISHFSIQIYYYSSSHS